MAITHRCAIQRPETLRNILITISLIVLYTVAYQYRIRHPYAGSGAASDVLPEVEFVQKWLNTDLITPFNAYPIAKYCNKTTWRPNLVFNLADANGGPGNVRGNILDFLFYAIEAGASITMPTMASRGEADIANVWAGRTSFDQYFEERTFVQYLGEACPKMTIYKTDPDKPLAPPLSGMYQPPQRRTDFIISNTKQAYLSGLESWMKQRSEYSADKVNVVDVGRTLFEIDTRSLPRGFRRNFGQLLRTNAAMRTYAANVAQQMNATYGLNIDPSIAVPHRGTGGGYYGAHLRTEADVQAVGWVNDPHSNFTAQTDNFLRGATQHNCAVIYVACGDANEIAKFRAKAASHNPPFAVVSKFDILPEDWAVALKRFTWDQQALVDFEILQRATAFGGLVHSSFSYNIALRRNQWLEDQGVVNDPWAVLHREDGVAYDDGLSRLVGRFEIHEKKIPRGMWP